MTPQDLKDLKQLVEFLREHEVAEFDLDRGDLKIRLKFAGEAAPPAPAPIAAVLAAPTHLPPQAIAPYAQPAPAPPPAPVAAAPPAAPAPAPDAALHIVKSPIVGTYYGSPSPGAAAFVAIGDRVDKGQVICIVEAMKLMNEIESDAAGEIAKCFVTNGQPIEFGQPLFAIRAG